MASYTCVVLALLFQPILLLLIGCVKGLEPNWLGRYKEKMYVFVYGSNLLLMLTAFFLLLLCASRYAYLCIFFILALPLITSLLCRAPTLNHANSISQYEALHDRDLNFFSQLSAVVVMMLFTSLAILVSSSPTLPRKNHQIMITECFLYITIIMSLLLLLLTTVPPAVLPNNTTSRMVGAVKFLAYTTFCFLAFVRLTAAGEIVQGFAVFSTSVYIAGGLYWFVTEIIGEHPNQAGQVSAKFDKLSMTLASGSFSVLMFVYTKNVDDTKLHSRRGYLPLLGVCMLSLCSTFIICLSKTVIFYSALNTIAWRKAEVMMSNITYLSLFVAALSSSILAVYTSYVL